MTDKITFICWRVIRPLFAALIGLTLMKAATEPGKIPDAPSSSTVIVKITDR